MKLPLIKRIDRADLAKTGLLPAFIDPLLDTLNPFIENVTLALQGRLTLTDNFLGKEVTQDFTHDVELEINPSNGQANLRVTGIVPLTTGGIVIVGFKWSQKVSGNVGVTIQFAGGTQAKVKLFIFLG